MFGDIAQEVWVSGKPASRLAMSCAFKSHDWSVKIPAPSSLVTGLLARYLRIELPEHYQHFVGRLRTPFPFHPKFPNHHLPLLVLLPPLLAPSCKSLADVVSK